MNSKPGYKSTEFYGSGVVTILGGLAATGLLDKDTSDAIAAGVPPIVQAIDALIDGLIKLVGVVCAVIAQVKYNAGRAKTKAAPEKIYIKN